jgi:paraquat-inducible protein B
MQTRANPTLIGLFVLCSLLLGIGAIFALGGDMLVDRSSRLILYFEGDVRGLQVGAPVTLKGVKVGQVEDISISYNSQDRTFSIPVIISIDQAKLGFKRKYAGKPGRRLLDQLIEQGLRAKLYSQSLVTGKMEIVLSYQPGTPARLMNLNSEYMEIPTLPSNLDKLANALEELPLERMVRRITEILDGVDKVLSETDVPRLLREMAQVIHRIDRISENLETSIPALTSGGRALIDETQGVVRTLNQDLSRFSGEWSRLAADSRGLIEKMDKRLPGAFEKWDKTLEKGGSAFQELQTGAASVNDLLRDDSVLQTELVKALRELAMAARSIRVMAEYLERHPEALLRGKN